MFFLYTVYSDSAALADRKDFHEDAMSSKDSAIKSSQIAIESPFILAEVSMRTQLLL